MAKQINVALIDDVDGSPATQTVKFAVGSEKYDLDLSDENAQRFNEAMRPFVLAAKRVAKNAKAIRAADPGLATEQQQAIRDWCNAHGFPVAARGRIPKDAMEAFAKSHPVYA